MCGNGARLFDTQSFCPSCGKAAGTVPLMPEKNRIAGHVRLLGILWLASAALHLIPGFFLALFFFRWIWREGIKRFSAVGA